MSYRIIISDDEPMLLKLIRKLGHFEKLGIEIVDECTDGEQALQSILEHHPDFVLTDIQMPVLDGLQMVEQVAGVYPDILFVLLSGYRVFEYAQSAVKLNVVDYLLKPVEEEQLNAMLAHLCQMTDERRRREERRESLQNYEQADRQQREERFWSEIFQRESASGDQSLRPERIEAEYGIQMRGNAIRVLAMDLGLPEGIQIESTPLLAKVEQILDRHFREKANTASAFMRDTFYAMICFAEKETQSIRSSVSAFLSECNELHEVYGETQMVMGLSSTSNDSAKLPKLAWEAELALWGRLVIPGNQMIRYEQVRNLERWQIKDTFWEKAEHNLSDAVRFLDRQEAQEVFQGLIKKAEAHPYAHPEDIRNSYLRIRECVLKSVPEDKKNEIQNRMNYAIRSGINLQQSMRQTENIILSYIQEQREALSRREQRPAEVAEAYLRRHYAEGISLEMAAEEAGVTSAHLSRIFKEFYGSGFNEYLTRVRLEESRRLLAKSRMSIREIAGAVGYTDEKYYSKIFRKEFGIKPTDYRRLYGK